MKDLQPSTQNDGQLRVAQVQNVAETWSPQHALSWAFHTFGNNVAISSAFGAEGMVLIDMASRINKDFRLFTVDTEFLFPETYNLMDRIEEKYGISIERVYSALSPEEQERAHGEALWSRNPTSVRAAARRVEWDAKFGLVKVNPIVDWSSKQVWRYIHDHDVPYNTLHDQDYPSIGCTHCTRAVGAGEDPRAGRWPGFKKTEWGRHIREPVAAPVQVASATAECGD